MKQKAIMEETIKQFRLQDDEGLTLYLTVYNTIT